MYKWLILTKKTYENNGIEVIVDGVDMLCLNEKHIEEKLGYKNLQVITNKYDPVYKKHRNKLVDKIKYLLCAIDLFSKYAWVVPLKDKRGITIVNAFQKIISKGRHPNRIWVDQGSEFYNNLFKRFLKITNIEMYSTYSEGKSERFIQTLKNKIFKYCFKECFFFDMLDDIVNKYNNTVHRTIKLKPNDVTSDPYAE